MSRYDYVAPLDGTERTIERPDGTRLRTVHSGSGHQASGIDQVALSTHHPWQNRTFMPRRPTEGQTSRPLPQQNLSVA